MHGARGVVNRRGGARGVTVEFGNGGRDRLMVVVWGVHPFDIGFAHDRVRGESVLVRSRGALGVVVEKRGMVGGGLAVQRAGMGAGVGRAGRLGRLAEEGWVGGTRMRFLVSLAGMRLLHGKVIVKGCWRPWLGFGCGSVSVSLLDAEKDEDARNKGQSATDSNRNASNSTDPNPTLCNWGWGPGRQRAFRRDRTAV